MKAKWLRCLKSDDTEGHQLSSDDIMLYLMSGLSRNTMWAILHRASKITFIVDLWISEPWINDCKTCFTQKLQDLKYPLVLKEDWPSLSRTGGSLREGQDTDHSLGRYGWLLMASVALVSLIVLTKVARHSSIFKLWWLNFDNAYRKPDHL